jgi:hypothetical protein
MTDYKALCAELVEQLNQVSAHIEATTPFETVLSGLRAYNRARNALAQPEPEGPSDEELDLVVIAIQALIPPQPDATTHHLSAVDRGREILRQRLARWVHPQGI